MLFRSQKGIHTTPSFRPNLKKIFELYPNTWRKLRKTITRTSSKGLLKGIKSDLTPKEIIDAHKENGFSAKNFGNIISRKKETEPLFKLELEPYGRVLKKNEVHPIYSQQYLFRVKVK